MAQFAGWRSQPPSAARINDLPAVPSLSWQGDDLERGGRLVNLLQRYTQVVMVSMAQLILCNRVHRLDQRAARWLLQVDERVDEAPFDVTQEFLAQMIGTQGPSVSLALSQFKECGPHQVQPRAHSHRRPRRAPPASVHVHQRDARGGAAPARDRRGVRHEFPGSKGTGSSPTALAAGCDQWWLRHCQVCPSIAQRGERVYIDWWSVKIRTGLSAKLALSSALGSPRTSPEKEPVAKIALDRSPRFAPCSMSASESL